MFFGHPWRELRRQRAVVRVDQALLGHQLHDVRTAAAAGRHADAQAERLLGGRAPAGSRPGAPAAPVLLEGTAGGYFRLGAEGAAGADRCKQLDYLTLLPSYCRFTLSVCIEGAMGLSRLRPPGTALHPRAPFILPLLAARAQRLHRALPEPPPGRLPAGEGEVTAAPPSTRQHGAGLPRGRARHRPQGSLPVRLLCTELRGAAGG